MAIKLIKNIAFNPEDVQPQMVWKMNIHGTILLMERYGCVCQWDYIKITKDGKEIYKIVYSLDTGKRKEYFLNRSFRTYSGDQFSFIEYIETIVSKRLQKERNFKNQRNVLKADWMRE